MDQMKPPGPKGKNPAKSIAPSEERRKERSAEALRDNLKKRRQQSKLRQGVAADPAQK